MKKLLFLIIVTSFLLSCVTTTNSTQPEEAIFSTDEYAVESFEENANGYLLTFLSIEDSVPEGAIIHISVDNSGEGRPYKKGKMNYQFGHLGIPETGKFNLEFGVGIPDGNQLTVRSKALLKDISKEDIQNEFYQMSSEDYISVSPQSDETESPQSDFVVFTVSSNVVIPEDKSYAGSVPIKSGVYLNSRNRAVMVDNNMGEHYSGDGSGYNVKFFVDYENEKWSLQIDSNGNGTFDDQEKIQGDSIDISDLKLIFGQGSNAVAYLVHYDMGYELYVYLGGKSYMMFLEFCEDC